MSKGDRRFVLGVDLDGVVADFMRGLKPIAADWLGKSLGSLPDKVSYGFPEWELDKCGGYEALHRHAVKERGLFKTLPPIKGAPAALRRLSTKSIRIRIITHRLYIPWFHREAVQQTVEWLEANAIPYWDLCFMRDKAAVGADLYLEDSPENIDTLRKEGQRVIVISNSTNLHIAPPRAKSWKETEQLVIQEIARWRKRKP